MSRPRPCRRFSLLEGLESRHLMASIAGAVAIDHDGDHRRGVDDTPISGAFVWLDADANGVWDQGEPAQRTGADGEYRFDDVAVGNHLVRYRAGVGHFQTSPAEQFAFQRDPASGLSSIVTVDSRTGSVTPKAAANLQPAGALIKTVDGTYYAAAFQDESLYRIDPTTTEQTLVGTFDLEIVAGLAYDPVMDEIYTLARESDPGAPPLRLYRVNRETAELIPVSDHVPELTGLQYTTSLTFDLVRREVVLFENATDKIYAYDLDGRARTISTTAAGKPFFNLSFDGHRFLATYYDNGVPMLGEVDLATAALSPITSLAANVNINAGDRLATNHPHEIFVADEGTIVMGADFLAGQMRLKDAAVFVEPGEVRLVSHDLQMVDPIEPGQPVAVDLALAVDRLSISVASTTTSSFSISLGNADNQVVMPADSPVAVAMGQGVDTLFPVGGAQWNLIDPTVPISGVDVVDLMSPTTETLAIDAEAIARLSDHARMRLIHGSEDVIDLGSTDWVARQPVWNDGRLHTLAHDSAILEIVNDRGWQNPLRPLDVNYSGDVTALDALQVINLLGRISDSELTADNLAVRDVAYVDTTGDDHVTALDALRVINGIGRLST